MASKGKKTKGQRGQERAARGLARAGIGALILGVLTWFLGGFTWHNAAEWCKTLLIAGGLALLIRWSVGEPYKIPSGSMEPTLHGDSRFMRGDRVFVNKFVYGLRFPFNHSKVPFTNIVIEYAERRIFYRAKPQRWDIVVFKAVEKNAEHGTLVKRVVGLPGERIHIAAGKVYVNGKPLELPPSMPPIEYFADGRYGVLPYDSFSVVPEDHYLLLGDHSDQSRDGRYWGWVPNEHILGRVSCIWWPPRRLRDFTGFSKTWWWRSLLTVLGLLVVWRSVFGRFWRVSRHLPDTGLAKGDHVYVNRVVFGMPGPVQSKRLTRGRPPQRGELVLYRGPDKELLLGRIAGLPGERVFLNDGLLFVNDAPVDLPALADCRFVSTKATGPYGRSRNREHTEVPEDHFFILSDDPEADADGRTFGWTSRQNLVGACSVVWWPPSRWRRIHP